MNAEPRIRNPLENEQNKTKQNLDSYEILQGTELRTKQNLTKNL